MITISLVVNVNIEFDGSKGELSSRLSLSTNKIMNREVTFLLRDSFIRIAVRFLIYLEN